MISAPRLAWLQLWRDKVRLSIAIAGVAFAVLLVFMQVGFQDALFRSGVIIHEALNADLVMISPDATILPRPRTFARRRLYQALAFPGVDAISTVDTLPAGWRNPLNGETRDLFVIGVNPADQTLLLPAVEARRAELRTPDVVLYDEATRPEFGPIGDLFRERGEVVTEANRHQVKVKGTFLLGNSFGVDGTLITSDETLRHLHPNRSWGAINIGVIRLKPGVDPEAVRAAMTAALPRDVLVLTKQGYIDREIGFWATGTPIGFVFGFGVVIGLVVGGVVVYQILFADISDHLPEYATLKAMGYTNRFLATLVLVEALLLAVLGYLPGLGVSWWLYGLTRSATQLPMEVVPKRAVLTLLLTIAMCASAALVAMRKLRSADPAEIF